MAGFDPTALITAPITGAFNMAGSKKQAEAAEDALNFAKQQKAQQATAAAPYLSLGQMAVGRLPNLAASGPTMGPPRPFSTQPNATAGAPLGQMGQPTAPTQPPMGVAGQPPAMVMVQAPTGETRQVPYAQAQQFVQRGAKIVG